MDNLVDPAIQNKPPREKSLIALTDVTLTLPSAAGPVEILRGMTIDIARGEAVGIVGPSGSGKTTLMMVIAGLEAITGGEAQVAGFDMKSMDEDALARFRRDHIGIVFQAFHLIPTMTAVENVAVPLEFKGLADAAETAEEKLKQVGLGHRLTHYPSQLSGGEQQRVAIARALAGGASIILADEPTGNLDQATGDEIINLLFSLQAEDDTTLLLVTHDPKLAAKCDRVIEIRDGQAH